MNEFNSRTAVNNNHGKSAHDGNSLLNLIQSVYMHHVSDDDDTCDTGDTGNAMVDIEELLGSTDNNKSRPGSISTSTDTRIRNPETGRTLTAS